MSDRRIVEVTWEDHASLSGQHPGHEAAITAAQESVGYFVYEDDKVIKLCQSVTDGKDINEIMVIDKRMMVRRRFIKR